MSGFLRPTSSGAPSGGIHFEDDEILSFGNTDANPNVSIEWSTADANANAWVIALPDGDATDVPVMVVGDQSVLNTDLGLFDGITTPSIAAVSADGLKYVLMQQDGTDANFIGSANSMDFKVGGGTTILHIGNTNSFWNNPLTVGSTTAHPSTTLFVDQGAGVGSGGLTAFTVEGGAHSNMAAGNELDDIFFDLARTVQWAAGAHALHRTMRTTMPTYAFVGSSTMTNVIGWALDVFPQAGTNAIFTNQIGISLNDSSSDVAGTADNVELLLTMPGLADGIGTVASISGIRFDGAEVDLGDQTATLTDWSLVYLASVGLEASAGLRTITNPATLRIEGPPGVSDGNVTATNGPYSILVDAGLSRFDGGVATQLSNDNITVGATPTDAELDTAFGSPETLAPGFIGILDDAGGGVDVHICFTTGVAGEWFFIQGTKAV